MKQKLISLSLLFLILGIVFAPSKGSLAKSDDEKKEFIIKSLDLEKSISFLEKHSIEVEYVMRSLGMIEIRASQEEVSLISQAPSTSFIEDNKKTRLSYTNPNDTLFPFQNYLSETNILSAWDITRGDGSIIVSVIDSGVNYNHEDIKNEIWTNSSGEHGYDFVSLDNDPMDTYFHGTMIAGIIGATTNNGKGIAGGAKIKIMAVRAIGAKNPNDSPYMGEVSDLVKGIEYSVENGARVINVSLGTPDNSPALDDAIKFATDRGCVVVAAVGNAYEGESARSTIDNPARNPLVIAVGALDESGQKPSYANYGEGVSVVAPGNKIYSTGWNSVNPNTSYISGNGTSFSAPQVSAATSLLLSKDPSLTSDQVKKRIIVSTKKINGVLGYSQYYGYGELDAYKALTYDKTPPVISASISKLSDGHYRISGLITDSDNGSGTGILKGTPDSNIAEIIYYTDEDPTPITVYSSSVSSSQYPSPPQRFNLSVDLETTTNANHNITIKATDTFGNTQTVVLQTQNALLAPTSNNLSDYRSLLLDQSPYITLSTGQTRDMSLAFKNVGNTAWEKSKVRLATTREKDRASIFSDSSWASNNRIYMQEDYVGVGEVAHFDFTMTSPSGGFGIYQEYFNLVVDGVGWMNDIGLYWLVTVENPTYHAQYIRQSPYITLSPGGEAEIWVEYKNTGSVSWDAGNVHLGTNNPMDRTSVFYSGDPGSGWKSANRISLNTQTVNPDEIGRFTFTAKAPNQPQNYKEYFRPVADGLAWMEDVGLFWNIDVR